MTSAQKRIKIVKLGDYIELVDIRNTDNSFSVADLRGISIKKVLTPTKADTNGLDVRNYKVLKKGWFTYSLVTSRNGNKISIAYNDDCDCIVSQINPVFKIKDESLLNPRYLMMFFNRSEFDRYSRFHSWGSARETFDWDEMCSIDIDLPEIDIQRKYVAIYESLLSNLRCYETGLQDLKLVCDGYFDKLKKEVPFVLLGGYVTRVDIRNTDNACKKVMGVSTSKEFREPTSKVNKNELSGYKICKPRQISFVQTTHNEKVFCNAMNRFDENVVVTSVNEVFECDERRLLPEFLCMYFNRKEFDRYARFHSWGSAREVFTWDDLINVKMPIPSIESQRAIVAISNSLIERKHFLNELKNIISMICPILIRGSVLEAEGGQPNAN